jgi:RHS repeat-associated protein
VTSTKGAEELLSLSLVAGDAAGRLELGRVPGAAGSPPSSRVYNIDREPLASGSADLVLAYGPRGELDRVEDGSGAWESYYDSSLRRVGRKPPNFVAGSLERWRYGIDRRVLAYETANLSSHSTEYIWLGGEVIGSMASTTSAGTTTTALYHVHSDRSGAPRKVSSLTGARIRRLIMDAWGRGVVVDDVTSSTPKPTLGLRYPGQWEDMNHRLINNGARTLISETGEYTAPEPLLRQTYERGFTGALAYSYAAGNPLKYGDSSGASIDTLVDLVSLGIGVDALRQSWRAGRWSDAVTDAFGVVADGIMLSAPGLTVGAGLWIGAGRRLADGAAVRLSRDGILHIGKKWASVSIQDPLMEKGCEKAAIAIQKHVGGQIRRIKPVEGRILGFFRDKAWTWQHHDVVVSGDRVYDLTTGFNGLPVDEYKSLWRYADALDFGF